MVELGDNPREPKTRRNPTERPREQWSLQRPAAPDRVGARLSEARGWPCWLPDVFRGPSVLGWWWLIKSTCTTLRCSRYDVVRNAGSGLFLWHKRSCCILWLTTKSEGFPMLQIWWSTADPFVGGSPRSSRQTLWRTRAHILRLPPKSKSTHRSTYLTLYEQRPVEHMCTYADFFVSPPVLFNGHTPSPLHMLTFNRQTFSLSGPL